MFSASSTPAVSSAKRRWTLVCSTILHAAILALIVAVPLASGIVSPEIFTPLESIVLAAQPPVPPALPPSTPVTSATPNADAAPGASPDRLAPEREVTRSASPGVPDGLDVPPGGVPFGSNATDAVLLPPPPNSTEPRRPGGDIRVPERTVYIEPAYPAIALSARVEGTVILETIIDETGAVTHVRVLRSIPLLDRAAVDAVSHWRYSPTRLNGVAVPIVMTVTVTFTLRHE
jgi:protein TonB